MYHSGAMESVCSTLPRPAPLTRWRCAAWVLLFFLVGPLSAGCSVSRTFTGQITIPEAVWSVSHTEYRGIGAKVFHRTNDDLLLAQGLNKTIGPWSILVEINTQETRAWLIVGKLAKKISLSSARERWNRDYYHPTELTVQRWGRRYSEESMLRCTAKDRGSVAATLPGVRALCGTVSVVNCSNKNRFNVILDSAADDGAWGVRGALAAYTTVQLGRGVGDVLDGVVNVASHPIETVVGVATVTALTSAAVVNGVHRAVDPDAPPIYLP